MIGVYDSGFGGLTVLRHLVDVLPARDYLYLGDSGRAPYGGRDANTILDFAEQCVEHLFDAGCRLVVVACHTVSCVALRHLQLRYCAPGAGRRVLGVSIPAAEAAACATQGRIGVLATQRTVASGTMVAELAKLGRRDVVQRAAPLLAPIVEEGWEDTDIARAACRRYLADLHGCEVIILGCTHYPLLWEALEASTTARLLDPGPAVALRLADWLQRHPGFDDGGEGRVVVHCTGEVETFRRHATRFFGAPLADVRHVVEAQSALAALVVEGSPTGQVVRPSVLPPGERRAPCEGG
jgi:glutamate racemase